MPILASVSFHIGGGAPAHRDQVPWRVHRYDKPPSKGAVARRASIPKSAFRPRLTDASMDFKIIIKGGAKTEWYSPATEHYQAPFADLRLIDELLKLQPMDLEKAKKTWVGGLMTYVHCIVVRVTGTGEWLLPLRAEQGSACLMWPLRTDACSIGGHTMRFSLAADLSEPVLRSVWDYNEWEACTFVFRSPAWVAKSCLTAHRSFDCTCIELFVASAIKPLIVIAAEHGFWSLTKGWLDTLVEDARCPLQPGSTVFDTCWALAEHFFPGHSPEQIATCLEQRLVRMQTKYERSGGQYTEAIPDAGQVMERRGEKQMVKEAKAYKEDLEVLKDFRESFRVKVAAVGGGCGGNKKVAHKGLKEVPKSQISHDQAKRLALAMAYVWKNNHSGSWNGRCPPYGDMSRSWQLYSERGALILTLQELWSQALCRKGLSIKPCPVKNLFAD